MAASHTTSEDSTGAESRRVAAYVAKYSTKSADGAGALDRRLTRADQIDGLTIDEHHRELVETAWRLGGLPQYKALRLRPWAHSLGYRGHWATRSRAYSTTLQALREARVTWHRKPWSPASVEVHGSWIYAGSGYRTAGDAWLAQTRQSQRLAELSERRVSRGPGESP